jgi:hypothetical protein
MDHDIVLELVKQRGEQRVLFAWEILCAEVNMQLKFRALHTVFALFVYRHA